MYFKARLPYAAGLCPRGADDIGERRDRIWCRIRLFLGQCCIRPCFHVATLSFYAALYPAASQAACSDLSLALAIDLSGSVDDREYSLQMMGYAAAFRNTEVLRALRNAGTVDVAVVAWGDSAFSPQVVPWHRIRDAASANLLATRFDTFTRRVTGDTGIGAGVAAAIDLLEEGSRCTDRKVINVSGDGRESNQSRPRRQSQPLMYVRQRAQDLGITINGLAIVDAEADLASYYQDHLITGEGAFVMQIDTFEDFATAIAGKLAREIGFETMIMSSNMEKGGLVEEEFLTASP